MNEDPRTETVTARVTFIGVMLACINKSKQYEVGMVHCPDHFPTIKIRPKGGREKEIEWPKGHDLIFKVTSPVLDGAAIHPTTNRDAHYDRVIDMEGFLFHRGKVVINKNLLRGRRLAFTAGMLYTAELTKKRFDLLTWTDDSDPGTRRGHIGTIAKTVGLNISCRQAPGSGIELLDLETSEVLHSMPANGHTYEITIENDCQRGRKDKPEVGTDFRYFYTQRFVTSRDGLKFDLGIITRNKSDRSPDACENTFLSKTDTLGIGT